MRVLTLLSAAMLLSTASPAVDQSVANDDARKFHADYQEAGEEIQKYADDGQSGAQKNFGVQTVHDDQIFAVFMGDRLEYQTAEGNDILLWDVQAWMGSDYHKLWFKSEGTWLLEKKKSEEAEIELFYSRNIATFWDLQLGIRHDFKPDPDRSFAALGVQGLAPLWFEVEATAYVSEDGDLSAAVEVEYDMLFTQRLILQPRFETAIALQEVEEYGIGQGVNDVELGLRLRYEIRRKFGPYIGVSWSRKLGETADLAEAAGEDTDVSSFVVGMRLWF